MTPDVAQFLRNILAAQTLQAGAPDLLQVAALASKALEQLDEIIAEGNTPHGA